MKIDDKYVLRALIEKRWNKLEAVSSKYSADYHSLYVHTDDGLISLSGDSNIFEDADEIFSLKVNYVEGGCRDFPPDDWLSKGGNWDVRDLTKEWAGKAISRVFEPPRHVRFWSDPSFEEVVWKAKSTLRNCLALEFWPSEGDGSHLFFVASQTVPINVGIVIDKEISEEMKKNYFLSDAIIMKSPLK